MRFILIFILILSLSPISALAKKTETSFEELNRLSQFSDIVVLQRRFLTKTGRFEVSPSLIMLLSSEFFIHIGLGTSLSFYFLEKHGMELMSYFAKDFDRSVTSRLAKIQIGSYIAGDKTQHFTALVYKWIPVYGKMAVFNKKIVPFDVIVSAGAGLAEAFCGNTQTKKAKGTGGFELGLCRVVKTIPKSDGTKEYITKKWEPVLIAGLGTSFSLSRKSALKMDARWLYYGKGLGFLGTASPSHHSDILLSAAWSFYFPSAGRR